jgi:hypothetical protein
MVNVVLEFDTVDSKIFRFTIHSQEDCIARLSSGDEIGFDLVESKEFFYATVSRRVYLLEYNNPIFIICIPTKFKTVDEATILLDKFRKQFGDALSIDRDETDILSQPE